MPFLRHMKFGLGVPGQPFGQQVQARLALEIIVFAPLAQTDSVAGVGGLELRNPRASYVPEIS
jgi:hypothetical protein